MKNENTKTNVNENKWESLIKSINMFSDDYLEDGKNLPKDIDKRNINRE